MWIDAKITSNPKKYMEKYTEKHTKKHAKTNSQQAKKSRSTQYAGL